MTTRACSTCKAWERTGASSGQCRHSPPAPGPSDWPVTMPDEWCAQWPSLPIPLSLQERRAIDAERQRFATGGTLDPATTYRIGDNVPRPSEDQP